MGLNALAQSERPGATRDGQPFCILLSGLGRASALDHMATGNLPCHEWSRVHFGIPHQPPPSQMYPRWREPMSQTAPRRTTASARSGLLYRLKNFLMSRPR